MTRRITEPSTRLSNPFVPLGGRETRALRPQVELERLMGITDDAPEKVGDFAFTVRFAKETPENRERFEKRAETLAALLLALWEREQLREIAERN